MKKKQSDRSIKLPFPIYTRGSDLVILSAELRNHLKTGDLTCSFCLVSLQDCVLARLQLSVSLLDGELRQEGSSEVISLSDLTLHRGEPVPFEMPLSLRSDRLDAFSMAVCELQHAGEQSTMQFPGQDTVELVNRKSLEEALGDAVLAEQFRVRYGSDCQYWRDDQEDLWFCVCGTINKNSGKTCSVCHRAQKAFNDVNIDALRAEAELRLRSEEAEPAKGKYAGRMDHRRSVGRWMVVLVPIVLLLALLIAAVPGAVRREHLYRDAVSLMQAGELDAAELAFQEIPSYKDSRVLSSQRIPYLRAVTLMEAAAAGDSSILDSTETTGRTPDEEHSVSMLLYEAAAEAFEDLGTYEDSTSLALHCREEIEREILARKQNEYEAAQLLLDEGYYADASAGFARLGDFSDSEKMVLECSYQKAVSLFHFLCSYDVSRVSARISVGPGETSIFSLPESEALRLGSGCIAELRSACGKDQTDIRLEDEASTSLLPLKDALKELFVSLGTYSDSASYPDRIDEETDYTREFYMLCSTGDLYAAANWLLSYEGSFPERDVWQDLLSTYLPFCRIWYLYLGDSSLIPFTIGQIFESTTISSRVLLSDAGAVLRLTFGQENTFTFDLSAALGETAFTNTELDNGNYYTYINSIGHLAYQRFDGYWNLISSCEYEAG